MSSRGPWEGPYLLIAALLMAFGVLAAASIGIPFLILGAAMFVGYHNKERKGAFAGIIIGTVVGLVVAVLIAPGGCTTRARLVVGAPDVPSKTVCDNLLGIDYSGRDSYNPPLWPALLGGAGGGIVAGVLTRQGIRRRPSSPTGKDGL